MEQQSADLLEYTSSEGIVFKIRPQATRGDQHAMTAELMENSVIENGVVIKTRPSIMFPWLIKRFVVDWVNAGRKWSYEALEALPADPGEDLIMVLGAYILNHVKGLSVQKEDESKKKD